jgi:CBS domain-containing protein
MSAPPPCECREHTGVLAERLTIPTARHERVSEPTAKSALAHSGPRDAATVREDATVADALKIMAERDTAAVAIVSPAGFAGILTERDYARKCPPGDGMANNAPVTDVMTPVAASVAPEDSVGQCLAVMNEQRATHLAVLDRGRLVGLLSQADLLAAQIDYYERVFHEAEMDQKLLFLRGTYSC